MNSFSQDLNSTFPSFPPVLARIPSLVDESAHPGTTPDELSEAISPAPDEKKETHQQAQAPDEAQKGLGDDETYQPAMRIEVAAVPTPTEKRRVRYQDQKQIQSQNEEQFEILDVRGAAKHMQCSQPQDRLIPREYKAEDADAPGLPRPAHIQVPEIAHRLGIGRLKVYAMLEAGLIPGIHFGRKWIITRFAYETWERTCGVNPSSVEVQ